MGELANKAKGIQAQQNQGGGKTLTDVIKSQMPKIMAVAPKHLSEERLFQMTVSAINREPKLAECNVTTILSCMMKCSALGLEPSAVDGLGRAFILPFYNRKTGNMEATFILGYKGMLELARRSGEIRDISARAVYEGDEFDFSFGLDERLSHRPKATDKSPDKLTHVYMVAHFKDGGHYVDVMTRADVDAVRKRSKAGNSGPWVTDYESMAKKTVIRRAFPYLPVSVEAQEAAASDGDSGAPATLPPMPIIQLDETELQVEEPAGERVAVCANCGNVVSMAPDATVEDLAQIACCDSPQYQVKED